MTCETWYIVDLSRWSTRNHWYDKVCELPYSFVFSYFIGPHSTFIIIFISSECQLCWAVSKGNIIFRLSGSVCLCECVCVSVCLSACTKNERLLMSNWCDVVWVIQWTTEVVKFRSDFDDIWPWALSLWAWAFLLLFWIRKWRMIFYMTRHRGWLVSVPVLIFPVLSWTKLGMYQTLPLILN